MTAARYDITVDQGSDFALELVIKEDGAAKNLDDWSVRASFRKTLEDGTAYTLGAAKGAATGAVTLSLEAEDSTPIPAGTYVYDFEIYETSPGQVLRILNGNLTLRREVTR